MAAIAPDPGPSHPSHHQPPFVADNHIDLTADDDPFDPPQRAQPPLECYRAAKKPRMDYGPHYAPLNGPYAPSLFGPTSTLSMAFAGPSKIGAPAPSFVRHPPQPPAVFAAENAHTPATYRPAFAAQHTSFFPGPATLPIQHPSPFVRPSVQDPRNMNVQVRQVIDLTSSPSPPPRQQTFQTNTLSPDLPPKTPVCIGQLTVTALILYPNSYLVPTPGAVQHEFAPVRLQYEPILQKQINSNSNNNTINIKTPSSRNLNGEVVAGEQFGVVEQKVATSLGPMLGKGLIRLDAKIRKGPSNLPILPMHMLIYTPKGNIQVVAGFLQQCGLLLDHPSPAFPLATINNYPYFNPHNPPPGGHANASGHRDMRWSTPPVAQKSVEVQRSQIDELFKSLKDGDELVETEASSDVATRLYPHQKKALTFLLEREREKPDADGKFSSLWQPRFNTTTGVKSWYHIVTQQEVLEEPQEAKGAILADDMGLGKTITCVSLVAATLSSSRAWAVSSLPPAPEGDGLEASHFTGSVWGMPDTSNLSAKGKAKAEKAQGKAEADYVRARRIKVKSRATLIICPLSTVANWEDQFREHWKGEVTVYGGNGMCPAQLAPGAQAASKPLVEPKVEEGQPSTSSARIRSGNPLRIYIYHGNARRPDPSFLADFDAVITTFSTLASEFSKQSKSAAGNDDDDDDGASSDGIAEVDEAGNPIVKLGKAKKGTKRKKGATIASSATEIPSALQSVFWFRVVLDEAHSIKETATVCCRASCDLMADRRLCLTGTPVQNKLDDVFALIKFLRLSPFNDKNVWTEFIGSPCKFGQALGIARLQSIMKCITLRRTKESTTPDGKRILSLPPRNDRLLFLKFEEHEQKIYDQFFSESKAEFNDLSNKNEIMKNYVGILQKILRLRQICDHYELVGGKGIPGQECPGSYEDIVAAIQKEGFTAARATAIFGILKEAATTQCVECCGELCVAVEATADCTDAETPAPAKRGRKPKAPSANASRGPTRACSPAVPRPILTKCQHLFCLECFRSAIHPNWPLVAPDVMRSCSVCQAGLSPADAIEIKADCAEQKKRTQKREKRQKGSADPITCVASTKIKALINDLIPFSRMNPHSANHDSEIQFLDGDGKRSDDEIVKTVVFSQWTSMLDKIEDALELARIRYDRLDGTMRREERTRAMDALKYDPGCEVLLVSLKAGGVGLNLTAAQRVYLMDPYWNPAVENQAVDRIHRLGQTRPVTTVKYVIENTIEARLLEVQRRKTELANMTLGQSLTKADILQRRMEELQKLFDG